MFSFFIYIFNRFVVLLLLLCRKVKHCTCFQSRLVSCRVYPLYFFNNENENETCDFCFLADALSALSATAPSRQLIFFPLWLKYSYSLLLGQKSANCLTEKERVFRYHCRMPTSNTQIHCKFVQHFHFLFKNKNATFVFQSFKWSAV